MEAPSEEYRPLFGGEITDRPLFGTSNRRDRVINLFVGCATVVIFLVSLPVGCRSQTPELTGIVSTITLSYLQSLYSYYYSWHQKQAKNYNIALPIWITLISAFAAHSPPKGLNVYFALCISLICLGHVVLIYWYRQGDLDPKFRVMIYYNAFTVILLSTCALSFFFTDM